MQQTLKDPYVFDFVAMTDRHNGRELESQLVTHVEKFLLELGQGFAFVGRQVRLTIGGTDSLLCQSENNVVAEYALRGNSAPIGVAEWRTQIVDSLPEEFTSSLPSIELLEAELGEG